jgi:hypothetical protein
MISTERKDLSQYDKQELLVLLENARHELKKKKISLREARSRLLYAKKKIQSLTETVHFQRKRIVDLYRNQDRVVS